jgi:hypothetical protein
MKRSLCQGSHLDNPAVKSLKGTPVPVELSGKVFENLLAAYNPETGASARKQTGSFYTPREIVNYMVDEALIACLKTKLEATFPNSSKTANDSPSPPTERSGVGGEGRGEVGLSSSRSANSIEQRLRLPD